MARRVFEQSSPAKLILISPLEQTYNNTAAPRLLVRPELAELTFVDLNHLKQRQRHHEFELVVGTVTKLDVDNNQIYVDDKAKPITYDYVVVATGQRSKFHVFKAHGDVSKLMESIKEMSDAIKQANSICVVGGGATGVEVIGEIAVAFPDKHLALVSGDKAGPLAPFGAKVIQDAEKRLSNLGVEVINNMADTDGNKVTVKGELKPRTFDLVIPTFGYTPNTSFIPDKYLDDSGYVDVDDHLKVKGTTNVFATGDCALITVKSAADINLIQLRVILNTVKREMFGESITPKAYKPGPLTSLVPIGPDGGVGKLWGFKVPSFVVWLLKLKDFTIPKSKDLLS